MKNSTLNWDRVVDELAEMPPRRLKSFLEKLQKRRRAIVQREGYAALAKLSFDDVPAADDWLTLENEALRLVEAEIHANSQR